MHFHSWHNYTPKFTIDIEQSANEYCCKMKCWSALLPNSNYISNSKLHAASLLGVCDCLAVYPCQETTLVYTWDNYTEISDKEAVFTDDGMTSDEPIIVWIGGDEGSRPTTISGHVENVAVIEVLREDGTLITKLVSEFQIHTTDSNLYICRVYALQYLACIFVLGRLIT